MRCWFRYKKAYPSLKFKHHEYYNSAEEYEIEGSINDLRKFVIEYCDGDLEESAEVYPEIYKKLFK